MDGTLDSEVRLFIHFMKIPWQKDENFERMSLLISILWNLKFLPKFLLIKNSSIIFQSWKSSSNYLFTQEHCILVILFLKSMFFIPPISKPLQVVLCLTFQFFPCRIKFFCVLCKISIVWWWSIVISKKCITLDTAKDLKTVILPPKVNSLMFDNFKIFPILTICSQKILFCSKILLYEKSIPSIFTVLLLRWTHFMPQSATWASLRTAIPTIPHFVLLSFNLENIEKLFNSLVISIIDLWERK